MPANRADTRVSYAIPIVRVFDAPRDQVFRHWVEAEEVSTWFAPEGFTITTCQVDARPGGRWRVTFRSAAGEVHHEYGEFREVVAPEKLVFTLTQEDGSGHAGPETLVTVVLVEKGAQTEMIFNQTGLVSAAIRDGNAEGWQECFNKLVRRLAEAEYQSASRRAP
jgi:uncharacterized protein YndB with AHSA1/START domain